MKILLNSKGVGRKFSRGRRAPTKKPRPKNSTTKPFSTLSVPCMKTQGDHGPPVPAGDAHA